jgi:hypothetical protein
MDYRSVDTGDLDYDDEMLTPFGILARAQGQVDKKRQERE